MPNAVWNGSAWTVPGTTIPSAPTAPLWSGRYGDFPATTTTSRDVHLHVSGAFYGSLPELAAALKPELRRLGV